MSNVERTTSWQKIQQGVKEAERLIARKEYNLVMVKARQTLEYMVRCLAERACLVEGDLADTIDQLYEGHWIEKSTKDNYHTIRILGNKAVHEGDDTAYDANQAYQLLNQEIYVFANEFNGSGRGTRASRPVSSRSSGAAAGQRSAGRTGNTGSRQTAATRTASRPSSYAGASRQGAPRRKKRRRVSPVAYILRFLIPLLVVILLIVIIRMVMPSKPSKLQTPPSMSAVVTTAAPEPAPTAPPAPETEPETEPEAATEVYRTTGSTVNVRKEPSTDGGIVVQLPKGTEIEYVKRYNNDWAVINYDGQEVYISSKYIEKVEATAETQAQ